MKKNQKEFAAAKTLAVIETTNTNGIAVRAVMSTKGVKSVSLQHIFVPSAENAAQYADNAGFLAAEGFDAKWVSGRHTFVGLDKVEALVKALSDAKTTADTFTAPVAGLATVQAMAPQETAAALLAALSPEQLAAVVAAAKNAKK